MKKCTRSLLTAVIAAGTGMLASASAASAANEDQLDAYVYVIRGPILANADAYETWSTNEVQKLYEQENLTSDDIGYQLTPQCVTQETPALTNSTLWFAVRFVAKDPTNMFSLDMMRFSESSSDGDDSMSNAYDLGSVSNLIYSDHALGVVWGSGGARASDTILDYENATNLVNEIDFIGMESTYYQYPISTVSNYLYGFTNFLVSVKCQIMEASNVPMATAQRTVQTVGSPFPPVLSIREEGTNVVVGFNMEANRTAVVKSSTDPTADFRSWSVEATINAGDELDRIPIDPARFYRAVLE